jgi:short-subunit dehydrogenase
VEFAQRYGRMAVIAGGSEGVGAAYARRLAERGVDLALIARKPGPLAEVADELRATHPGREVLTLALDLTAPDACGRVVALTGAREVGLLICNAGASEVAGEFLDGDLSYAERLAALNATVPMTLAYNYGRPMRARGRGGIILVGSMAGLVGNPGLAVYGAAKAFSQSFAQALWHELKPYGVHVLGHTLSLTATPSVARCFPHMAGLGDDPDAIALQGLEGLSNGPLLRAAGGEELTQMLAALSPAEAAERAWEMGAPFRAAPAV